MFRKNIFLKISQNENLQSYSKEARAQVFPNESFEMFKNNYFPEYLQAVASVFQFFWNNLFNEK